MKKETVVEAFGTVMTIISLYLMTEGLITVGSVTGVIGSLLWVTFAYLTQARYLLFLNVILGCIYMKGILF
jgi:hypothetical protein